MKTIRVAMCAALAGVYLAGTSFGQLPGLPPAAGGTSGGGGAADGGNNGGGVTIVAAPTSPLAVSPALPPPSGPDVRPGEHRRVPTVSAAGAIRGSLFRQGATTPPLLGPDGQPLASAAPVSFIAVQPAQPHKYKKNDIVTLIVREDSDSTTNGKGTSNKTQDYDMAIQQFIQLALSQSGLPTVGTVNNPSSLPEVKFKYTNNRQSNAEQDRTDSLSARVAATVVDVKPNGNLVLEATKSIYIDKEEQIFKLSGMCRVDDIAADNTVISTQLADLYFSKQTKGEVRDGTKRGWLNKLIDTFNPF